MDYINGCLDQYRQMYCWTCYADGFMCNSESCCVVMCTDRALTLQLFSRNDLRLRGKDKESLWFIRNHQRPNGFFRLCRSPVIIPSEPTDNYYWNLRPSCEARHVQEVLFFDPASEKLQTDPSTRPVPVESITWWFSFPAEWTVQIQSDVT